MKKGNILQRRAFMATGLMAASAVLAQIGTPRQRMAAHEEVIDLETMIPAHFGNWRVDQSILPVQVAADVQAKLDKIYSQTVGRTYVSSTGIRVMLSVAYGGDQSDGMRAHRPEVCYSAQGFQISKAVKGVADVNGSLLPVSRLIAWNPVRAEPITYWMLIGDQPTRSSVEQKLAQIRYGLAGVIPSGMLVRVSSIDPVTDRAYRTHEQFIRSLERALAQDNRPRLFGRLNALDRSESQS